MGLSKGSCVPLGTLYIFQPRKPYENPPPAPWCIWAHKICMENKWLKQFLKLLLKKTKQPKFCY